MLHVRSRRYSRFELEESILDLWRKYSGFYSNCQHDFNYLETRVRALGMRPSSKLGNFMFINLRSGGFGFFKISSEAKARKYLEDMSDAELYALKCRLAEFGEDIYYIRIRDAIASLERQLRHHHDWRIYERVSYSSADFDD